MQSAEEQEALTPRVTALMERDLAIGHYTDDGIPRGDCVDLIYRASFELNLEKTTPFAATRVFDLYMAEIGGISRVGTNCSRLSAMACLKIAGKCIDHDDVFGYDYPDPTLILTKLHPVTAFQLYQEEITVMRALNSNPIRPTPHEYIAECTRWLDGVNAAIGYTVYTPQILMTAAMKRCGLMCDAFVHTPRSLEFTSWEIAGASSYFSTEILRAAPQATSIDTPTLRALWRKVPWTRGVVLKREMQSAINAVYENPMWRGLSNMYVN